MSELKGLQDLYTLYKGALTNGTETLDPNNDPEGIPKNMGTFVYTINFFKWGIAGDTKKEAMEEFCNLYETKLNSEIKINNFLDPDILAFTNHGKSLKLAGSTKAEGLYFWNMNKK